MGLYSLAAALADLEGRGTTARTLARQALDLRFGPGPYPLGSPTLTLGRRDAAELPGPEARAAVARRLWAEAEDLLDRGYLVSGYVAGMLAVVEEPTPERGAVLHRVAEQVPAPVFRHLDRFVTAMTGGDAETLLATADALADVGLVEQAIQAYAASLRSLRTGGRAARAAEAHDRARRRLSGRGAEVVARLRSAAESAELTAREEEIARLAASGLSNQDIARRLLISVRTVENHLHRAFRKLGVENRAELSRVLAA